MEFDKRFQSVLKARQNLVTPVNGCLWFQCGQDFCPNIRFESHHFLLQSQSKIYVKAEMLHSLSYDILCLRMELLFSYLLCRKRKYLYLKCLQMFLEKNSLFLSWEDIDLIAASSKYIQNGSFFGQKLENSMS